MKTAAWITFIYGILILIGGIIGHVQSGSTASLVTGIAAGVLLLLAAVGMFRDHLFPCYFGIILIFALDAFFTYRWLLTMNFLPAGLMSLISLVVLIAVVLLIRKHLKQQRKQR